MGIRRCPWMPSSCFPQAAGKAVSGRRGGVEVIRVLCTECYNTVLQGYENKWFLKLLTLMRIPSEYLTLDNRFCLGGGGRLNLIDTQPHGLLARLLNNPHRIQRQFGEFFIVAIVEPPPPPRSVKHVWARKLNSKYLP